VIVLKIALNHAVEYGYLFRNPAEKVKVRVERHEFTALTPDQARQFLKSIEGHRLYALYRTAIYLGLRQGELIRLTWDDMDFEKRTLKVKDAKTRAGIRTLPLSSEMVRCLQAHQERLQEERKKPGWKEHNLVFPSSVGTKLNQTNLLHHFKTALGKAGLPMVRFHDLRHTSASLLYEAGVPEATISKLLGHSTINITMDIYTHIRQKTLGDAADQMERFLEDEEDEENEEGEEA
jgi:integrase